MKTHSVKAGEIGSKKWFVVDANGQTLGRLAVEVARVLRGKHKPTFTPHLDTGDGVIVVNAEKIVLTGNKLTDKLYHHHTGWMGGIKAISARDLLAKHPDRVITHAVKGMLPKNKLGRAIATHLRVYAGPQHGQESQKPEPMPVRKLTK